MALPERAIEDEGLRAFLRAAPADFPFAIFLLTAGSAFENLVARLVAIRSSLTVLSATDGVGVSADHVYLLPQDACWGVEDGRLHLATVEKAAPELTVLDRLTIRQQQVLGLVLAGESSKRIASTLSISRRTVENHRAAIMRTAGCRSLPALVKLCVQPR